MFIMHLKEYAIINEHSKPNIMHVLKFKEQVFNYGPEPVWAKWMTTFDLIDRSNIGTWRKVYVHENQSNRSIRY